MKITVAGAGWHGSEVAFRIAGAGYARRGLMVDVVEGKPQAAPRSPVCTSPLNAGRTGWIGEDRRT